MYKNQSKQISITDFNMPMGMELDPNNRWVLKAATIPWDEVEKKYAKLFRNNKCGNVAYPLRLALGSLIIKATFGYSDVELAFQIQENPYLQYFCGLPGFTKKLPFDPSTVTYFRKRLTDDVLGEINEMIIAKALSTQEKSKNKDNKPDNNGNENSAPPDTPSQDTPPKNKGTLILDSTCVPQHIRFPLDLSLLDEARRKLEKMIDFFHSLAGGMKPRTYRRKARKDFLIVAKKKKKSAKEIRKAIGKQLDYIARDIRHITEYRKKGFNLPPDDYALFFTICKLFDQQLEMYKTRTHTVKHRIVSIRQPWVRPIVRGKARAKVEFGAKIDISVYKGFTRLEHSTFEPYNESENFVSEIEKFFTREKHYPKRVLVDKIYRNQENILYCNKHGIEILGKPLGRPSKDYVPNKRKIRKAEIDRIEVERKIGLAKGSYNMALVKAKLKNTSLTMIALSILAMNITKSAKLHLKSLKLPFIFIIFMLIYFIKTMKKSIKRLDYQNPFENKEVLKFGIIR